MADDLDKEILLPTCSLAKCGSKCKTQLSDFYAANAMSIGFFSLI